MELTKQDRALLSEIQDGLPLAPHPYSDVAARLGISEQCVIDRLRALQHAGIISRFGVVVRHHELGYTSNAMTVWDVPDEIVADTGRRIAAIQGVTLCYRRPRRLPDWPYNLFCMVHGKDRQTVLDLIDKISADVRLNHCPRAILFSVRRFKQRGARYGHDSAVAKRPATVGA
jgi:DNA-binding Lrp family transcriptional regulator